MQINKCGRDEFVSIKGIGDATADLIIENRPYTARAEVEYFTNAHVVKVLPQDLDYSVDVVADKSDPQVHQIVAELEAMISDPANLVGEVSDKPLFFTSSEVKVPIIKVLTSGEADVPPVSVPEEVELSSTQLIAQITRQYSSKGLSVEEDYELYLKVVREMVVANPNSVSSRRLNKLNVKLDLTGNSIGLVWVIIGDELVQASPMENVTESEIDRFLAYLRVAEIMIANDSDSVTSRRIGNLNKFYRLAFSEESEKWQYAIVDGEIELVFIAQK